MAKKSSRSGDPRRRAQGPRMESLGDVTPENMARSKRRGPVETRFADPEKQRRWEERKSTAEARRGQRTFAPLIVFGAGVLVVGGVVVWGLLSPDEQPAVEDLQAPVIAAQDGGSDLYPPNSREAVEENVKFGYLPAVELQELADGTVVLGSEPDAAGESAAENDAANEDAEGDSSDGEGPAGGEAASAAGFPAPYADMSTDEFAEASIPSPRDEAQVGTPVTWEDIYRQLGGSSVFLPAVDTEGELNAVLELGEELDLLDALIVRTADDSLAAEAHSAGVATLFTGDAEAATADAVDAAGYRMAAVPADSEVLDAWAESSVQVWATGVESAAQLEELSERGVLGALAADPFALRPSDD